MSEKSLTKQVWKSVKEDDKEKLQTLIKSEGFEDEILKRALEVYLNYPKGGLNDLIEIQKQNPTHFAPIFLLGNLYEQEERPRKAFACFSKAADLDSGQTDINWEIEIFNRHEWLEMVYLPKLQGFEEPKNSKAAEIYTEALDSIDKGRPEVAKNKLNKALKHDPDAATIWTDLGHVENNLGNLEASLEAYEKAKSLCPEKAVCWYNSGTVFFKLNQFEKALEYLLKSLELDPDDPDTLYNTGLCYWNLNKESEAKPYFEETLFLVPDYLNALFYLAKLEAREGQNESAQNRIAIMLENQPNWKSYFAKDPDLGALI